MPKLPWMKFFPSDYLLDTQVLTPSARGIWMDLICHLWRSNTRGTMTLSTALWSMILRVDERECVRVFEELKRNAICNVVTDRDGHVTVESRRIVKEENARTGAAKRMRAYRERRNSYGAVTVEMSEARSQKLEARDKKEECMLPLQATDKRRSKGDMNRSALEKFDLTEWHQSWSRKEFGVTIPDDVFREFKAYWLNLPNSKLRSDWDATLKNRIRTLVAKGILTGGSKSGSAHAFCQERVKRENFLKPCGAPSVSVMNGRPLCKEHYEQRNHTASA